MAAEEEVLRSIAEYAARYGLKPEQNEGVLVILHSEYPVKIVVEPSGDAYVVELRVGDEIGESIEGLLEENVDPRAELEDIIETMVRVVDYATRKLEAAGYRVKRSTREAILDLYDALESYLEEEE